MNATPEFSGLKGRFFAWALTSPLRHILHMKMGNPDARFMQLLDLSGGETIVDSGCGSGHHTLMVADRLTTGRIIGLDISQEMLAALNKNAKRRGLHERVETLKADALAVPLDDAIADRAITLAAWHHLDDPQAACHELARLLRPSGKLIVVDLEVSPTSQPAKDLHVSGHDRAFTSADMRRIFETAGLHVESIETVGRWLIGAAQKPPDAAA